MPRKQKGGSEVAKERIRRWVAGNVHDTLELQGLGLRTLPDLPQNVKHLNCCDNQLRSLPVLPPTLKTLICYNNELTSLPALPASLTELLCSINKLETLPDLPPNIQKLYCTENVLTSLPDLESLTKLIELDCTSNILTELPELPSSLTYLVCNTNELTSLPSLPRNITFLECKYNQITELPPLVHTKLETFSCEGCQLETLPPLPNTLLYFNCAENHLTSLPPLPDNLFEFNCSNNNLTIAPVLPDTIEQFNLEDNEFLDEPEFLINNREWLAARNARRSHNTNNNNDTTQNNRSYNSNENANDPNFSEEIKLPANAINVISTNVITPGTRMANLRRKSGKYNSQLNDPYYYTYNTYKKLHSHPFTRDRLHGTKFYTAKGGAKRKLTFKNKNNIFELPPNNSRTHRRPNNSNQTYKYRLSTKKEYNNEQNYLAKENMGRKMSMLENAADYIDKLKSKKVHDVFNALRIKDKYKKPSKFISITNDTNINPNEIDLQLPTAEQYAEILRHMKK